MIDLSLKKYSKEALQSLKENLKCYPEDGELWWSCYSDSRRFDKPVGSLGGDGYSEFNFAYDGKPYRYKAHIVIWAIVNGEWPKGEIDHINRVRSDNRISNLRLCSSKENSYNKSGRGKSKYRGVHWHSYYGNWVARIQKDGVGYFLGTFKDEYEAHLAYKKKAEELYGEYYSGD